MPYPIDMTLKDLQDAHIDRVLRHYHGNKTLAAKSLGVNVKTVYNRVKRAAQVDEERVSSHERPPQSTPAT
jgi:DNA-binding protein Fis